jgi:hypothetical protein
MRCRVGAAALERNAGSDGLCGGAMAGVRVAFDSSSGVDLADADDGALEAFGDNLMNLAGRPSAARAGHAHGNGVAGLLTDFWC